MELDIISIYIMIRLSYIYNNNNNNVMLQITIVQDKMKSLHFS